MPGQRRAFRGQIAANWAHRVRRAHGAVGLAGLVVLAVLTLLTVLAVAGTVEFVFLTGDGPERHPRPLSTSLASQQLAGLAVLGPANGSPHRLLALSGQALAFIKGGSGTSVLPSEQWQADQMTDGSYILVYVPNATCLNAARSAGGASPGSPSLSLKACNLRLAQRWSHPYLGKDAVGRDYWQLRSNALGLCLSAGTPWRDGTPARLAPCGPSHAWPQLVEFWSAY